MLNRYLTISLLTIYFFLIGFTNVSGEAGVGISGRVIYADFFVLVVMMISFLFTRKINLFPNLGIYFAFLFVMFVSLIFARDPSGGWIEILVHFFNFVTAIALFNLVSNTRDLSLSDILRCFLYSMAAIAVLGILQFMVFPSWFGGREVGGLVGTFRNTGQAGTFFGMGLAVFIPALAAGLLKRSPLNLAALILILICLILTVKRASILGLSVGILGFVILLAVTSRGADRKRNLIFILLMIVAMPVVSQIIDYGTANVKGLENRFERKIENFTVEEFSDKFFGSNIGSAMDAFEDNPILGAGPGNIIGDYTDKYEIHSTPFSILSSAGLLGLAAYLIFLLHWIYAIWRAGRRTLIEEKFLFYFQPFLFGLIVSWGYTYHVRKREFWVLYAIIAFAIYIVRRYRNSQKQSEAISGERLAQQGFQRQPTMAEHRP
ncbi:MAG: O-antigen ligase family protein [Sphingorhabdus sp.]